MAVAEIDIRLRLDKRLNQKAERAAASLGLGSVAEYILRLIDEDTAERLNESPLLPPVGFDTDAFERFVQSCDEKRASFTPVEVATSSEQKSVAVAQIRQLVHELPRTHTADGAEQIADDLTRSAIDQLVQKETIKFVDP